jgi:hypothetical protein
MTSAFKVFLLYAVYAFMGSSNGILYSSAPQEAQLLGRETPFKKRLDPV